MQTISALLEKQIENPSPEEVLGLCRTENIHDRDISEILMNFLRKVQGERKTREHWDKVRAESLKEMKKLTPMEMKQSFLETYHAKFKKEFILDKFSERLINILCLYFSESKEAENFGLNLNKGILLHGGVGTGKSSILSCFTKNQKQSFRVIDCLTISKEFMADGHHGIERYAQPIVNRFPREFWGQDQTSWCFDDLGVESEKKHFGNEVNVMEDIIQGIYDRKTLIGNIHFTTNLAADQINVIYGQRVASRLREMINIIELPPESPDRRI